MSEWSFLTNHARVLLCIARDPGIRLRDIAATVGITERTAFGVVADLTDGRRNRYEVQHHLPFVEPTSEERTIGDVLELLGGRDITRNSSRRSAAKRRRSAVN
jgi:hypothetical protein